MLGNFFSKLFAKPDPVIECESVDYKDYTITPAPEPGQGDFYTAGTISKKIGDEEKSTRFIRADRHPTVDQAEQHSLVKAKQIIDEQGDRLFNSSQI